MSFLDDPKKFQEFFEKVLDDNGAMLVDRARLEKGIREAFEHGYRQGYEDRKWFRRSLYRNTSY